jgi:hypothetical protein
MHYLLIFVVLLPSACISDSAATEFIRALSDHPGDMSALIDLFQASQQSWVNRTGWLVNGTSYCSWHGIECDCSSAYCRVSAIKMRGNMLVKLGQYVPDSIGNLTELKTLMLYQNYLSSTLPASIGNLVNLLYMDIGANVFTGSFPATIGNCLNLKYLSVLGNLFTSFPAAMSSLPSLIHLDISKNPAISIPPSFPACSPSLQTFKMLSQEYSQPQNHSHFRWLCSCTALSSLEVSGFTGSFPDWLGCLQSLTIFYMSYNTFNSPLSDSICSLAHLTKLQINLSSLTGLIPDCWDQLLNLTSLNLQNNLLQSTIPASLGRMRSLKMFDFNSNLLVGSLPSSLAASTTLVSALAANNFLTGTLDMIMGIPTLNILYLNSNRLTGTIPCLSDSIKDFEVMDNLLDGTLPANFFQNESKLSSFKISGNKISGAIPSLIPRLLFQLRIDDNRFEGTIPDWLCFPLKYLSLVNFANNSLTGTIPACLGQMSLVKAVNLNFSMNALTGTIPSSLGFINRATLRFLDLHGNLLTGTIPDSLSQLASLSALDLSFNLLSGTIPSILTQIATLDRIDLSHNFFSGKLGDSFENAATLPSYLNVSHNRFTGLISTIFGQCNSSNTPACPSVTILDARANQFDCPFPKYDQLFTLFLRDACSPPYTTFAIYCGSLAGVLLILLLLRYIINRRFETSVSIISSSHAPNRLKWLFHSAFYLLNVTTLSSDVFTMFTIGEYLMSRIDNCALVNSFAVWKSLPAVAEWYIMVDPIYFDLSFPQFVYKLITTLNSYYGSSSNSILNPFDVSTKVLLDAKVDQFETFCLDIQSGCALRRSADFPTNYDTECYMAFDDQAPFGGTSHRLFFFMFTSIVSVRVLVELSKASVVLWSCLKGRIAGAQWSIDFVGTSVFSPLFVIPLGGEWSEYFKTVVSHEPSYSSLVRRVIHQSLLCSIPLLCANLYFLFAVSQSGLQLLNMFSVLSACLSIPVTIVRAVLAWRSTDRSFSITEVAQMLQLNDNAVDVDQFQLAEYQLI